MKGKKQLEIYLQGLLTKERYNNFLEQYPTDSSTAAYILSIAYSDGNIAGRTVLDLGTGNGVFACGAAALGSKSVTGIDVDADQISVARTNCGSEDVHFYVQNARSVTGHFDTVVMNAPFGSVNTHADMPFLEKAVESGDYIYSVHNAKTRDFVRNFYMEHGEIFREEKANIIVGRLYEHHTRDRATIPGIFFSVRVNR